ncbi:MAG: hypothetical protein WCA31_01555 [Acidimicrobiales bacterium]
MTIRRQVKFIAAICFLVLLVGGILLYALPSHSSSEVWGRAIKVRGVPGVGLETGANLYSISCPGIGDCSAVGQVERKQNRNQPIVEDEVDGKWRGAQILEGLSTRNEGLNTGATVVSCAAPGDCAAGGSYSVTRNTMSVFVATETHGRWGNAVPLAGPSIQKAGSNSYLTSISCASPGNCAAGGNLGGTHGSRAFVVDDVRGVWGKVTLLSGAQGYSMHGTNVSSISCASPGSCSAVGDSNKTPRGDSAFSVSEKNGVWGSATEIPGLAELISGGTDVEISVSCSRGPNCSAEGNYLDDSGVTQSFLVDETEGTWSRAFDIPGIVALDGRHIEELHSISCGAPGDCVAGGAYGTGSHEQAFLVNEVNGQWGDPMSIPGLATINKGKFTTVDKVSCPSAGNCGVIGGYNGKGGYTQAFASNEVNGSWGLAEALGAPSFSGAVGAQVSAISCAPLSTCTVTGNVFMSMTTSILFLQSSRLRS